MIRLANNNDIDNLIGFLVFNNGESNRKLATEYVNCCFSNDYRKPIFVILELEKNIIGAAAFSKELFTTGTWGISWVSVHKNYRNKGYGEQIVQYCLDEIKKLSSCDCFVVLGTYPNKTGLYEKLDFESMYSDSKHGSYMIKKLR
jgi:N-acetylglutamate synthase-like GNAT family acetyltransferase